MEKISYNGRVGDIPPEIRNEVFKIIHDLKAQREADKCLIQELKAEINHYRGVEL